MLKREHPVTASRSASSVDAAAATASASAVPSSFRTERQPFRGRRASRRDPAKRRRPPGGDDRFPDFLAERVRSKNCACGTRSEGTLVQRADVKAAKALVPGAPVRRLPARRTKSQRDGSPNKSGM